MSACAITLPRGEYRYLADGFEYGARRFSLDDTELNKADSAQKLFSVCR